MNDMVLTTEEVLIAPAQGNSGFSWRAVFAGAVVAAAAIFFLLALGSGVGLSLFSLREASASTASSGLTLGAIYFFAAQAFGLAIGGYVAGRLMGPVLESHREEVFHASTHGLVVWAVAVVMTATMAALSGLVLTSSGLNAAATLGASDLQNQSSELTTASTGYWVDTLFRPVSTVAQTAAPPSNTSAGPMELDSTATRVTPTDRQSEAGARAEAGRILTVGLASGNRLSDADHARLVSLVSQFTGADMSEASRRVDDVQTRIHDDAVAAAETARKFARYLMLWLAASLIFGALVSSASAVSARWIDDQARAGI